MYYLHGAQQGLHPNSVIQLKATSSQNPLRQSVTESSKFWYLLPVLFSHVLLFVSYCRQLQDRLSISVVRGLFPPPTLNFCYTVLHSANTQSSIQQTPPKELGHLTPSLPLPTDSELSLAVPVSGCEKLVYISSLGLTCKNKSVKNTKTRC